MVNPCLYKTKGTTIGKTTGRTKNHRFLPVSIILCSASSHLRRPVVPWGASGRVTALSMHRNLQILVTGSADSMTRLWNAERLGVGEIWVMGKPSEN